MKKIYLISGLGADKRVIEKIIVPGFESVFINWEEPDKKDSISSYAKKLLKQIDLKNEVILVGVSFGGMICQEINKLIKCEKVIIISSVKTVHELSLSLKFVKKTRIDKLFPATLLKFLNTLTVKYFFSVKSKEESKLLKSIISKTDLKFMTWAIDSIMKWDNEMIADNIVHIHGLNDKVFPVKYIKNYISVEDAGHFMIINKINEINEIIKMLLTI
jgi:pimeloyl-ACP methyl ester carboxylesterase